MISGLSSFGMDGVGASFVLSAVVHKVSWHTVLLGNSYRYTVPKNHHTVNDALFAVNGLANLLLFVCKGARALCLYAVHYSMTLIRSSCFLALIVYYLYNITFASFIMTLHSQIDKSIIDLRQETGVLY